ncbi:hypothetical protein [Planctomicrobium sp. SH664]|uniref:hypothetical protein n=1 Tax=Planctomicrobium sp. SH664 TaxID=3448125 RepID=UPI003F5C6325
MLRKSYVAGLMMVAAVPMSAEACGRRACARVPPTYVAPMPMYSGCGCAPVSPCGPCGGMAAPVMPMTPMMPAPCGPCGMNAAPVVGVQTQIRREAQVVSVPVTTYRSVTVDEGSYQQVWVPKLVTKSVPQTTIQQHVQYRDVPYQTVQEPPQYQTSLTPIPETASIPAPYPSAVVAENPRVEPSVAPQKAAEEDSKWTKVPQAKSGTAIEQQNYEFEKLEEPAHLQRFSVPSAASAWMSRGNF